MHNAKNQILELLAKQGHPRSLADFAHRQTAGGWESTLVLTLPGRAPLTGVGTGQRKSDADIAASKAVLAILEEADRPDDLWAPIYAEAQAGDALLKLAAYLAPGLASAEERSKWLQLHESDVSLARVFDRWFDAGDSDLAPYGRGLGEKNKATLVEALIWRRYGADVLGPEAVRALGELREALSP